MRRQHTAMRADTPAAGRGGPAAGARFRRDFERHLHGSDLVPPGSTVLVAVSGGLDSVALLHLLRFGSPAAGLRLVAAHLDHAMRPDSAADGDWVAGLCRAWDLPLERGRAAEGLRSEAEARAARYDFLRRTAARVGAERVLTAHHFDDQAETVLFQLLRGTGPRGLRGIAERRGSLARPLLPFRRRQIQAYAAGAGIRYREDPTNLLGLYVRNRIRHEIMPLLESAIPGAARSLVRLARHATETENALRWMVERLLGEAVLVEHPHEIEVARPVLLSYHPYLRARLLRHLLRRLGSFPDWAGTRAALQFISSGSSGREIQVAGGVRIRREFDRIRLLRTPSREFVPAEQRALIPGPGAGTARAMVGGTWYEIRWGSNPPPLPRVAAFDPEPLHFPLELRGWRPGDRIRMSYGTKKLKKLFMERRIGRSGRARLPVLVDGAGAVLWVPGVARSPLPGPAGGRALHIGVADAERG